MVKKIVKNVGASLGKLALDTAAKAVKEPLGFTAPLTSGALLKSSSLNKPTQSKVKIAQMINQDKISSRTEMDRLKQQLVQPEQSSPSQGRDVEKEIREVRAKKRQLLGKKEQELLTELQKAREEEEKLAQEDAQTGLPSSNRPQKGSALSRKGKGTKEMGKRRSV